MKNFQTSISQVYQKILIPYFYHKYLRTHAIRKNRAWFLVFFDGILEPN
jgi:hypothetical protein